MPELIDDRGNLFGRVNVVDALVVLLVLAVVVAGAALVLGGPGGGQSSAGQSNQTVVYVDYRSVPVEPYVADVITEGPVPGPNVTSVENKSVAPAPVVSANESGALSERPHPTLRTVRLRVGLNVTRSEGEYLFRGAPLEVGTRLRLDLGPTTIVGNVTAIEPSDS